MDEEEFRAIKASQNEQDRLFRDLIRRRLEQWLEYVEDKLDGTGVQVFAAPGNDDFFEVDELLSVLQHDRVAGDEGSPPHRRPRDHHLGLDQSDTMEHRARMLPRTTSPSDSTRCSTEVRGHGALHLQSPCSAQQLEDRHLPEAGREHEGGLRHGQPGDGAGRAALPSARRSNVCSLSSGLHGHIHEGRGETRIGRTLCLNPGSVYSEGVLNGLLLTLAEGQVRDYQFTQG